MCTYSSYILVAFLSNLQLFTCANQQIIIHKLNPSLVLLYCLQLTYTRHQLVITVFPHLLFVIVTIKAGQEVSDSQHVNDI